MSYKLCVSPLHLKYVPKPAFVSVIFLPRQTEPFDSVFFLQFSSQIIIAFDQLFDAFFPLQKTQNVFRKTKFIRRYFSALLFENNLYRSKKYILNLYKFSESNY